MLVLIFKPSQKLLAKFHAMPDVKFGKENLAWLAMSHFSCQTASQISKCMPWLEKFGKACQGKHFGMKKFDWVTIF
jgi:hypothetical protein